MKKLILLVCTIGVLTALGTNAQAKDYYSCDQDYYLKFTQMFALLAGPAAIYEVGHDSEYGPFLSIPVTMAASTSAPSSTTYDAVNLTRAEIFEYDKVYDLLNDAETGEGVVIREFAEELKISLVEALELVRRDDFEMICGSEKPLSYSKVLELARNKLQH